MSQLPSPGAGRKLRGGPPQDRDFEIYERHILQEETQERVAVERWLRPQPRRSRGEKRTRCPTRERRQDDLPYLPAMLRDLELLAGGMSPGDTRVNWRCRVNQATTRIGEGQ